MTDQCYAMSHGSRCVLPDGHDGAHETYIELPPDVARIMGGLINDLEANLRQARRRQRQYQRTTLYVVGANIAAMLVSIWAMTTHLT